MTASDRFTPDGFFRHDRAAPLFSLAGVPVAVVLAFVLMWPVAATGHLLAFPDSTSYVKGGDAIWRILGETIWPAGASDVVAAAGGASAAPIADDTSSIYGRSITYAAVFGGVVRVAGPLAMTFLQTLIIAFAILAMINGAALRRPYVLIAGLLGLVALSHAAWLSVYLMPDVLGAIVLLFSALLVARFDRFSTGQKLWLALLAAFAVSSHYGNIPLALATVGAALLWRFFLGEARGGYVIAAGIFVICAAPLLNMAASFAVLGETSMTPLRPPVVLARSLEDGPARWYIEQECADSQESYCAAFKDGVAQTHYDFLWGEEGLETRGEEAAQSVRENEWQIVLAAALEYPLQQATAVLRNTAQQFTHVGGVGTSMEWNGSEFIKVGDNQLRLSFDPVFIGVTALSGVVLAVLLLGGWLTREQRQILGIVVFGLVVNAFIFGALSAPAARYQARVAWLLPLLVVLFVAENGFWRRDQTARSV